MKNADEALNCTIFVPLVCLVGGRSVWSLLIIKSS
jgi:hypothetical protein